MTTRRSGPLKNVSNWVAPCKPALCDYFVEIFQVPQNRLKFGMSTPFVPKKVPVFFSRMQKDMDKIASNSTPPPSLSLSVSKQHRISILQSQNTVRVSFTLLVGEDARRGGGLSRMCLKPCFPACEKNAGTFFHRRGVGMPNFSGFWATWKIATK